MAIEQDDFEVVSDVVEVVSDGVEEVVEIVANEVVLVDWVNCEEGGGAIKAAMPDATFGIELSGLMPKTAFVGAGFAFAFPFAGRFSGPSSSESLPSSSGPSLGAFWLMWRTSFPCHLFCFPLPRGLSKATASSRI